MELSVWLHCYWNYCCHLNASFGAVINVDQHDGWMSFGVVESEQRVLSLPLFLPSVSLYLNCSPNVCDTNDATGRMEQKRKNTKNEIWWAKEIDRQIGAFRQMEKVKHSKKINGTILVCLHSGYSHRHTVGHSNGKNCWSCCCCNLDTMMICCYLYFDYWLVFDKCVQIFGTCVAGLALF